MDFPIKNGGSFHCYVSSPEGNIVERFMVGQHDLVIGSASKALRAMVLAAQRPGDVATATLLGSSELVKQARPWGRAALLLGHERSEALLGRA